MTLIPIPVLDLRSLRLERRLALRLVAERAGIDLTQLKRWERGLELPSHDVLQRLAAVLEVDVSSLDSGQRSFVETATPGEGYTTARHETTESHTIIVASRPPSYKSIRVLDLFCGSGGFSAGFEQTGEFAVTAGIDLLPDRVETFRRNHVFASNIIGDIRSFPIDELGDLAQDPDVIIGGPPCQGFSSIRPFRMCTLGDPRNNLFEHFALVVKRLRPKWFVLENVVGLLSHGSGQVLPSLVQSFEQAGYTTDWRVVNAAQYGLPQNRERLVVVGSRERRRFEWPSPTHHSEYRSMAGRRAKRLHVDPLFSPGLPPALTVMEAIHDLPEIPAGGAANSYRTDVVPTQYESALRNGATKLTLHEATAHSENMLKIIRSSGANRWALPEGMTSSGFSSSYSRLSADEPSVTLTVNFVHPSSNKCIHPSQHRALTPREGARLQGFPDTFEFVGSRSQIVKQIGNAVPPLLGRVIADALLAQR